MEKLANTRTEGEKLLYRKDGDGKNESQALISCLQAAHWYDSRREIETVAEKHQLVF